MGKHNEFGKLGEQLAVDFLTSNGYRILAQNYRFQKAEIDIIADKGGELCIIEVKSRNKGFFEDISKVIDRKKIGLLTMAADEFVIKNDLDIEVRFDVLFVIKETKGFEIEHIENAFYHF